MEQYKISQSEIISNNVKSAADIVKGDPRENKSIFDRLPELIATKFNSFVDNVIAKFSSYYTKEEVNEAINQKVIDIGAGDMATGIYDKTQTGVVDNSERVNGCWIAFKDEEGKPTTEPYLHWLEDDEGNPIITAPTFVVDLTGDFTVETDGNGRVTIVQGE